MNFLTLRKTIDSLLNKYDADKRLTESLLEEKHLYEKSLHAFLKAAWSSIEGQNPFIDGWALGAMAEHLEALAKGDISYLIINIPPRCCKSTLCSVAFPAWLWTTQPSYKFFFTSYAKSLSLRDSRRCRFLIQSNWYQRYWGHTFHLLPDANNIIKFVNNKMGYRLAGSVGGSNTGEGGDFLIYDDPNDLNTVESTVVRESINEWHDQTMGTRGNNPNKTKNLLVQQRGHERDFTGHILSKNIPGLVHLCLPMEYEEKPYSFSTWKDPRTKEGELLWPERFSREAVDHFKKYVLTTEYRIAGQFQQRPSPAQGNIIKKHWFKVWPHEELPFCHFIIQSWDTAFSNSPEACYSACTTWGIFRDSDYKLQFILLGAWRGRLETVDLKTVILSMSHNIINHHTKESYPNHTKVIKPHTFLIEAKGSGIILLEQLNRAGLYTQKFDPTPYGDKVARARSITPFLASGNVWVPNSCQYPFVDLFLSCCSKFPNNESNDIVDSTSQTFIKLLADGLLSHPDDRKRRTLFQEEDVLY